MKRSILTAALCLALVPAWASANAITTVTTTSPDGSSSTVRTSSDDTKATLIIGIKILKSTKGQEKPSLINSTLLSMDDNGSTPFSDVTEQPYRKDSSGKMDVLSLGEVGLLTGLRSTPSSAFVRLNLTNRTLISMQQAGNGASTIDLPTVHVESILQNLDLKVGQPASVTLGDKIVEVSLMKIEPFSSKTPR